MYDVYLNSLLQGALQAARARGGHCSAAGPAPLGGLAAAADWHRDALRRAGAGAAAAQGAARFRHVAGLQQC